MLTSPADLALLSVRVLVRGVAVTQAHFAVPFGFPGLWVCPRVLLIYVVSHPSTVGPCNAVKRRLEV